MAEYKREVGAAVSVAIVLAVLLGALAIYSFPSTQATHSTMPNTSQGTTSTATSKTVTTVQFSSTIPFARTYTNLTAALDPSLAVQPIGNLSMVNNATKIATSLALNLGELPIQLASERLPTCSDSSILCTQSTYLYKTAKGSTITVAMVSGAFYELDYIVQNYTTLSGGYWNTHPAGNPPTISEDIAFSNLLLKSYGLDFSKVALNDNITGPGWAQWSQEFDGLQISNSGVAYFEVFPPTSGFLRIIIIEGAGWNVIPSNLPIDVAADTALATAKSYATNTIQMGFLHYAEIAFQVTQGHLYYAATISNQTVTYVLFVNPQTGQVGYP